MDSSTASDDGAWFRYDDQLRESFAGRLAAHPRRSHPLGDRKHAAVAIVLVDSDRRHDVEPVELGPIDFSVVPGNPTGLDGRMTSVSGGAAFVLCRRASRLNAHAGQWALPGGRVDAGETALEAALRECEEEIGLRLDAASMVGWLDDYPTRSGYVITPVVLWGGADPAITSNPDEVMASYRIGLHTLRSSPARFVPIPESDRPVLQLPLGGDIIHAPTGAVLYQFRRVAIDGAIGERVDDFEQPVFAWR